MGRCPGCGHAPHVTGLCEHQQHPPCDCNVDEEEVRDIPVTLVCSACPEGERFKVPVGVQGIAIMREHLRDRHGIPLDVDA